MRTIVIGGDGAIGHALAETLRRRGDVVYDTTRRRGLVSDHRPFLDLATEEIDRSLLPDADIVFFCAAIVSFATCRENSALARRVNATNPVSLARRLVASGTRVVLLSTSAVYDWSAPRAPADRPPCPLTKYGEFAAQAERGFAELGPATSILRLTKLLTPDSSLFADWISRLAGRKEVVAFSDLHISPISINDAIDALLAIAGETSGGIFQVSGAGDISYHDAAVRLALRLGVDPDLVGAQRAADVGIPRNEIPRFASLDTTRITKLTGWVPPDPYNVIDTVFGSMIERARTLAVLP